MIRWWEFLLISVLIILIVLGIQTYNHNMILRTLRLEEKITDLEQSIASAQAELLEAQAYAEELEAILYNVDKTVQTVSPQSTLPSRSNRGHSAETMPVLSLSGFTAEWFNRALSGTGMAGLGEALAFAEQSTGVNAVVLAGIIALESDWGQSSIARDKNNLAGICAYSGSAYASAKSFDSQFDCVLYLANMLKTSYLSPDGKYYHGDNLIAIGKCYAEDPAWSKKVAVRMSQIVEKAVAN